MVRTVLSGSLRLIVIDLQCLLNQPYANCPLALMTAPAMKPLLLRVDGTVRVACQAKRSATTKETAKKSNAKAVGTLSAHAQGL